MIMSTTAIAWFMGSLLVGSWTIQLAALQLTPGINSKEIVPWLITNMFLPSIWSIIYLALFNRSAWKLIQFRLGNPLFLLIGALIPAVIAFGVLAIMAVQGWAQSPFFSFSIDVVTVLSGPWILGDGAQGWLYFALNVGMTAIYFAGINALFAAGEEFGWRGVVQHHMIERIGFFRGVALLGFIWGIWHAPINLSGYNDFDSPMLVAFVLFPIELIAMSFIMASLTLSARSFWPAVLVHGSTNGSAQGVVYGLTMSEGVPTITAKLIQIALIITVAVLCIVLMPRRVRTRQDVNP